MKSSLSRTPMATLTNKTLDLDSLENPNESNPNPNPKDNPNPNQERKDNPNPKSNPKEDKDKVTSKESLSQNSLKRHGGSMTSLAEIGTLDSNDLSLLLGFDVLDMNALETNLFTAINEGNRDLLLQIFQKYPSDTTILQVLLTTSLPNRDAFYKHDKEILQEAAALLGPSLENLNALQIACLLGEEDMALDIIDFVVNITDEIKSKKILFEFMGRIWGDGNTTLHLASFIGMTDVVTLLIELGAAKSKPNLQKYRPVDCANDDETRAAFETEEGETNLKHLFLVAQPRFSSTSEQGSDTAAFLKLKSGDTSSVQSISTSPSVQSIATSPYGSNFSYTTAPSSITTAPPLKTQSAVEAVPPRLDQVLNTSFDSSRARSSSSLSIRPRRNRAGSVGIEFTSKMLIRTERRKKKVKFDPATLLLHLCQFPDKNEEHVEVVRECLGLNEGPPLIDVNNVYSPQQWLSPLHVACSYGHVDIARVLIMEAHAAVNIVDKEGWTPLHCACAEGQVEVVRFLGTCQGNLETPKQDRVKGLVYCLDGPIDLEPINDDGDVPEDVILEEKMPDIQAIFKELKINYPPAPRPVNETTDLDLDGDSQEDQEEDLDNPFEKINVKEQEQEQQVKIAQLKRTLSTSKGTKMGSNSNLAPGPTKVKESKNIPIPATTQMIVNDCNNNKTVPPGSSSLDDNNCNVANPSLMKNDGVSPLTSSPPLMTTDNIGNLAKQPVAVQVFPPSTASIPIPFKRELLPAESNDIPKFDNQSKSSSLKSNIPVTLKTFLSNSSSNSYCNPSSSASSDLAVSTSPSIPSSISTTSVGNIKGATLTNANPTKETTQTAKQQPVSELPITSNMATTSKTGSEAWSVSKPTLSGAPLKTEATKSPSLGLLIPEPPSQFGSATQIHSVKEGGASRIQPSPRRTKYMNSEIPDPNMPPKREMKIFIGSSEPALGPNSGLNESLGEGVNTRAPRKWSLGKSMPSPTRQFAASDFSQGLVSGEIQMKRPLHRKMSTSKGSLSAPEPFKPTEKVEEEATSYEPINVANLRGKFASSSVPVVVPRTTGKTWKDGGNVAGSPKTAPNVPAPPAEPDPNPVPAVVASVKQRMMAFEKK